MTKKKLIHFAENLTFPHLFQPKFHEFQPEFILKSRWHSDFFMNDHPVIIELGCGKGEYTVGLAQKYPEKNFIGIDWKGARLWRGCKTVSEQNMKNVAFVRTLADHVPNFFADGEVSEVWITFPDPQPKKERRRLTAPVFLQKYKKILIPEGIVHLKTDDQEFYQYSLEIMQQSGFSLLWSTDDLYHSGTTDVVIEIQTFYERKWLESGKKIYYLCCQLS